MPAQRLPAVELKKVLQVYRTRTYYTYIHCLRFVKVFIIRKFNITKLILSRFINIKRGNKMQIQSTNSTSFGKMGKLGKSFGRTHQGLLKNPYSGKVDKLVNRYKNELKLLYNPSNYSKTEIDTEIAALNSAFLDDIAELERKKGIRGKLNLEY